MEEIAYKLYFNVIEWLYELINIRGFRFILSKLNKNFRVNIELLFDNIGNVTKINKVFWLIKGKEFKIVKSNSNTLSSRMLNVINYEHNHFIKEYAQYAYHYGLIDEIQVREQKIKEILRVAALDSEIYQIYVPDKINPVEICDRLCL